MKTLRLLLLGLLLCIGFPGPATGDERESYLESELIFARRIASLIREKCLGCHGQELESIEGGLDLQSRESLVAGGESGQAGIVPGQPEQSSVFLATTRDEEQFRAMPPKESESLDEKQLGWLRRWIETGAVWPDEQRITAIQAEYSDQWSVEDGVIVPTSGGLDANWTDRRYDPAGLWAYQPIDRESVSAASIDQLINERMPPGLAIAGRADRQTLIRRASFGLTGLPPTPDDVASFFNDPRDDRAAFAAVIDRLLDSPHYGERMAQHWLDVTRYADSSGFANDYERGNAWRYRDYVIRSFNDDKPYDQFVREQIAGDELLPGDPEGLIATGFLRMGSWELTGMEVAKVARGRFLDDVTNSVGETFLGQSLQCCRCHDHKFDPIPTRDYYRIQAVFATTQLTERRAEFLKSENTAGFDEQQYLELQKAEHQQTLEEIDAVLLDNAERWFDELNQAESRKRWNEAVANAKKSNNTRGVFNAARNGLMRNGVEGAELPPLHVGFTPEQFGLERVARKGLERLTWELERYQPFALSVYNGHTRTMNNVAAPLRIPRDRTGGELERTCIRTGGDPFAEGEPVQPGTLSVIVNQVNTKIPKSLDGRRGALANWIADAKNPLTTRVIVNRIWQWNFGRAIAGNPNNFGSTGERPTHPKLLDWLASQLVEGGWSIKNLHRQIMNSDVYCRASSHPDPATLAELDPRNSSYAAFQPRRLSAEELRDAMLLVSDQLNSTLGGIPCRPVINLEVALQPRQVMGTFASAWTPNPTPEQRNRRSIYVLKLRGLIDPSLEVFNAPSPDFSCERRDTSTITPQVFTMFNGDAAYGRSLALAEFANRQTGDRAAAVRMIYERLFARPPTGEQLELCLQHWHDIESLLPDDPITLSSPPSKIIREAVEENTGEKFAFVERLYAAEDFVPDLQPNRVDRSVRGLADVCLVLINSNEFVYVY